jgi:predicted dinucleotide-binding enzyme
MGGKLGTVFARAGHEVVFGYARSEQKLKRLAREAQGQGPLSIDWLLSNLSNQHYA